MQNIVFSKALNHYLAWKLQLRNFIEGEEQISSSEIVSPRDCDLGKWLYSEGMSLYGELPEMQEIEKAHIALHDAAENVYHLKTSGNILAARQEMLKLETASMRLFSLLTVMKKKIL